MEPASDPWTCSICTYQHEELAELGNDRCSMCEAPRHKRDRVSASLVSQRDSSDDADSDASFGSTHICSRETDVCGDLQVALAAFGTILLWARHETTEDDLGVPPNLQV